MRKQLIPFVQVIKFCKISSSRRGFNPVRPCYQDKHNMLPITKLDHLQKEIHLKYKC